MWYTLHSSDTIITKQEDNVIFGSFVQASVSFIPVVTCDTFHDSSALSKIAAKITSCSPLSTNCHNPYPFRINKTVSSKLIETEARVKVTGRIVVVCCASNFLALQINKCWLFKIPHFHFMFLICTFLNTSYALYEHPPPVRSRAIKMHHEAKATSQTS